jgi:hypothetical protein
MSININGIRGKKLELSSFLEIEDPDIIAIQETKIDRNILTSEIQVAEEVCSSFYSSDLIPEHLLCIQLLLYTYFTMILTGFHRDNTHG